jgi:hypothetical protein
MRRLVRQDGRPPYDACSYTTTRPRQVRSELPDLFDRDSPIDLIGFQGAHGDVDGGTVVHRVRLTGWNRIGTTTEPPALEFASELSAGRDPLVTVGPPAPGERGGRSQACSPQARARGSSSHHWMRSCPDTRSVKW